MYLDYASVWNEDISEERLQKVWAMLTGPDAQAYSLAAVKDGVLAGFAHYMLYPCTYSTKLTCYLQDLYVHPQARGQGVAGTLIDTLVVEGKSQGWRNVH